jgi:hypothetical protein
MPRRPLLAALLAAFALLVPAGVASADATPVGSLPGGPLQEITVKRGQLVAIALPKARASSGYVWRIARAFDADVVRQAEEADVGSSTVVVVFRAQGVGRTTVTFAQTKGDASAKAVRANRYRITVRA